MKPRRTHFSNQVFRLEGGTEDNDLWVHATETEGGEPVLCSTWEPTIEERALGAAGGQVELIVWGAGTPPVAIRAVNYPLGAPPRPLPTERHDDAADS